MSDPKKERANRAPDESRRAFLVGTAVGAVASGGLVESAPAAHADAHAHSKPVPQQSATPHEAMSHHGANREGAFFNDDDYATVVAFTERLFPGAPGKPGATEANVANYIDLALSGAYLDQQYFYRQGLAALDAYAVETHKDSFVYLKADIQDQIIAAMEEGKATGFTWPSARAFFETLRTHTIEGMFADPVYGGNKDFAGWRLVGFPGAQVTFTEHDMASDKAFTRLPIVGLQQTAAKPGRRG